jgi:hypothetical protein
LNDARLFGLNVLVYVLIFGGILVNFGVHEYLDEPFAFVAESCIIGKEARPIKWPAKTWSVLNLLVFQGTMLLF